MSPLLASQDPTPTMTILTKVFPALRSTASIAGRLTSTATKAVTAYSALSGVYDHLTSKSTKNYPGHIPLSRFENAFLAVGSATVGIADTRRGGESFGDGLQLVWDMLKSDAFFISILLCASQLLVATPHHNLATRPDRSSIRDLLTIIPSSSPCDFEIHFRRSSNPSR